MGQSSESGVAHNLAHPGSPWPSSKTVPVMAWCVSRPGANGKLQSCMCRCAVRHSTDVPKDGMTTSGYEINVYSVNCQFLSASTCMCSVARLRHGEIFNAHYDNQSIWMRL